MPTQAPQWTEFLSCPICYNVFNERHYRPISLGCGHTVCKLCLGKLQQKKCPFDQSLIVRDVDDLPVNFALLQLVGVAVPEEAISSPGLAEHADCYLSAKRCIEELAILLKPVSTSPGTLAASTASLAAAAVLSRPMQRKLVGLVNCQLVEEEGRARAMRAARSLGERTVTEMILQHQNAQQLSANLWAAVRARGCQFLGPAMQEEVLKLILLALEDGSALSRKVLVLFVVQRLASQYPQASKTAIGHVVQLLYRASCFKVTKREEESSLMQLKEEFRTYEALRREHDSQIVQIATEAGLRISPEQWSSLLYGDTAHKSHMQSIIDKLQTPQSFVQSVNELAIALQRSGDPGNLSRLRPHYELLANIDPSPDTPPPSWENLEAVMKAVKTVVQGLVEFSDNAGGQRKTEPLLAQGNTKYKTHMCRDLAQKGRCPRGTNCTFAHSQEEMERYRLRSKRLGKSAVTSPIKVVTSSALSPSEQQQLAAVARAAQDKMLALAVCDGEHIPFEVEHGLLQRRPPVGVTVPVMKPSQLPASTKNPQLRQTIYTSPTATTDDDHRTELVPISNRVPAMHTQPVETMFGHPEMVQSPVGKHIHHVPHAHGGFVPTGYREHNAYMAIPPPPPQTPPSAGPPGRCGYIPETMPVHMGGNQQGPPTYYAGAMPVHRAEGGQEPRYSGEETMKNIVSLPPNPYTSESHDIPTRDSHYYLTSNVAKFTRGKSPSQQLGELHQRRNELIAQLTKTKTPDGKCPTEEGVKEPGMPPTSQPPPLHPPLIHLPVAQVKPRPAFNNYHVQTDSPLLSSSVADSMATTLSTMSFARASKENSPGIPTGYGDCENVDVRWSPTGPIYEDQEDQCQVPKDDNSHFPQEPYDAWTVSSGLSPPSTEDALYWNNTDEFDDDDESAERFEEADDEFVPFEHNVVSKYGPISRMAKTKMKATGPLQVTAAQTNGVTAVTAVTPIRRPYPVSAQVPSRFSQGYSNTASEEPIAEAVPNTVPSPPGQTKNQSHDHIADPGGVKVATSLPTALMQPNLIAMSNNREPHTLWALRERLGGDLGRSSTCEASNSRFVNLPGQAVIGVSETPQDEICNELQKLNVQIECLQTSEDERLARELQAIELNIQETERKIHKVDKREAARRVQVEQDRRLAQKIVLDEARQKGLSMQNEGQSTETASKDKTVR